MTELKLTRIVRSGVTMTAIGTIDSKPTKLTNIVSVEPSISGAFLVATDHRGKVSHLVLEPHPLIKIAKPETQPNGDRIVRSNVRHPDGSVTTQSRVIMSRIPDEAYLVNLNADYADDDRSPGSFLSSEDRSQS